MKAESLAEKVWSVLEERARIPVKNGTILLREKRVMDVKVVAVPQGSTVISLEKIGSLGGVRGKFQSRCDYLVLFRLDGKDTAVFIEIKKRIRETSKGLEQLRMSPPYLAYLRSLCQVVFNGKKGNIPQISIHYVLVGKRTTPFFDKQRVSDAQGFPIVTYQGIEVRIVVGKLIQFDQLWQQTL